jgi:hypothetical protein
MEIGFGAKRFTPKREVDDLTSSICVDKRSVVL